MKTSSAVWLTVLSTVRAAIVPHAYSLHETRAPSSKWIKRDRIEKHAILPLRIGLSQQNLDNGPDYLMDVSDPSSPNYAKHWTAEEVIAAFSPSDETVDAVRNWLIDHGISRERIEHSTNKAWLGVDSSAEEMETLFRTEFHQYEHAQEGHVSVACDSYHVPNHLKDHIDYITPGVKISAPLTKRGSVKKNGRNKPILLKPMPIDFAYDSQDTQNCDKLITPACIRALYQVPLPTAADVAPGNSFGIYESGDTYAQEDLDRFFQNLTSPKIPTGTHPILNSVDGGAAPVPPSQFGGESDLDFQLAFPLVYPQNITLFQVDDLNIADSSGLHSGEFNTFLDAIDGSYCNYTSNGITGNSPIDPVYPDPNGSYKGKLMCGVYKPTNVISISYGVQEDDLPGPYQKRQCNEFLKLGLQGVSIIVASGDTGVAGIDYATNSNGCLGPTGQIFNPTNPNSCPWLTNVGATQVFPGQTVNDPESAVYDPEVQYYSSGGFSNLYPIPSYQTNAVKTFYDVANHPFKTYNSFGIHNFNNLTGRYNRAGRGIPDVAANGMNIAVVYDGFMALSGGTSASAPIFASIITRINAVRIKAGKKPLGFLNPALYTNPSMLNDITNGTNPGCGTKGFEAVKGWDPVTGLGTPNYPKMLQYFMSLK